MIDWLAFLVSPLNQVLFTFGDDAVSWAELLGFLTGGACVALTVRRSVADFPVGIANSALFLLLFLSARLWADGVLQLVFIALGVTGWWQWQRGGAGRADAQIGAASMRTVCGLLATVALSTGVLNYVLEAAHDSAPFWDALTTSLSLAAQWLLNTRKVQTWRFWIAADVIYIPLYISKNLGLTALVYVLFLALCILGYRQWRDALADRRRRSSPTTVLAAS